MLHYRVFVTGRLFSATVTLVNCRWVWICRVAAVPKGPLAPGNEEADRQANLAREGRRTGTVRETVYTLAANRTRRISEAKTAAKAEWEANKCS